jgi:hypothetical protein
MGEKWSRRFGLRARYFEVECSVPETPAVQNSLSVALPRTDETTSIDTPGYASLAERLSLPVYGTQCHSSRPCDGKVRVRNREANPTTCMLRDFARGNGENRNGIGVG